jgi:GNAT superfamily N-acetyltransferase
MRLSVPDMGVTSEELSSIRRLTPADLGKCLALAADRDWPREERKWRFLLTFGEAFGVDAPDGDGLAGTVIAARYPGLPGAAEGLTSISMMLVASRYSRRGLGERLMTRALGDSPTATLYATSPGRPLYERLGFHAVEQSTMYVGRFSDSAADNLRSRPSTPADREAICRLDAKAIGVDRTRLLDALPTLTEQIRVVECAGRLVGYAGTWQNEGTLVAGPVIAEDDTTAQTLITDLFRGCDGDVRLDVARGTVALHPWARERGLTPTAETVIMTRGQQVDLGDRGLRFAPVLQALG